MGRIVYNMSVSLDGRVDSAAGSLDWVTVDTATHRLFNDEARRTSAFLMGRRMYELLQAFWPTADADAGAEEVIVDFARIWREKPKYVFSTTLDAVDPTATLIREVTRETVERLKRGTDGELSVGGPTLASAMIDLGLVDEFVLYLNPVVVGGGKEYWPPSALPFPLKLELIDATVPASGILRLAYAATEPKPVSS